MISFEGLIVYNSVLAICIFVAFINRYSKAKLSTILILFTIISVFSGLRYYVGNDYKEYVRSFKRLSYYLDSRFEIGFEFLNQIFIGFDDGFVYVMLISSMIIIGTLLYLFCEHKLLIAGIFFLFTTEFIFMMNDQVRQALMLVIFLFSVRYIIDSNFLKYAITISIGSLLFHYSGILLLGVYFIRFINFSRFIWIALMLGAFLLHYFGWAITIFYYLISKIPFYGEKYILLQESRFLEPADFDGTGLGILFNLIVLLYVALFSKNLTFKNTDYTPVFNIYMVGGILYFLFLDFFIALRFVSYLTYVELFLLPMLVTHIWSKGKSIPFFLAHLIYFIALTAIEAGRHGGFPYQNYLFI